VGRRRVPDGLPEDPRALLEAGRVWRRQELGRRQAIRRRARRSLDAPLRPARSGRVIADVIGEGGIMHRVTYRLLAAVAALLAGGAAAQSAGHKVYQLPTGSYPHDGPPAADGTVWFSGQSQGIAGRFDPQSGKLEKIPLGPGAAPHGVIVGPDGNAWLTEGGQNAIARVDAATTEVKLYPLPAAFARANLNTLVFDNA